ncbi:hypothetical protein ACJX0J_037875, partial [Zea mays]
YCYYLLSLYLPFYIDVCFVVRTLVFEPNISENQMRAVEDKLSLYLEVVSNI